MNLSEHYTLEQFTASETAARLGLDNTPSPAVIENLKRTAAAMEQVRLLFGAVHVNSAYRGPEVNKAVGGVTTSAHEKGLACDFTAAPFGSTYQVAVALEKSGIEYDQLILEYGWVHIGLSVGKPRRMSLTKKSAHSPYESGIIK